MNLIFPNAFYEWAQTHPMVWWADRARWALDRIAPSSPPGWELDPTVEVESPDDTNNRTGNRIISDYRIDVWDQAIMAVCVAGWRYAVSLGKDGDALAAMQARKDQAALEALIAKVDAGEITKEQAEDVIRAEVRRQAQALGVDISFVDGKQIDEKPQLDRPALGDVKADWVAYATQAGVDTSGMTKDQIIAAVGKLP